MRLILQIWRQQNEQATGRLCRHEVSEVTAEMSFLDLLDRLNETLLGRGEAPIASDSDCREGICGACGVTINGRPHGPLPGTFTAAKLRHLALLPQGQPERDQRTLSMVAAMDAHAFGGCSSFGECQQACPKGLRIEHIAAMNRDHLLATLRLPTAGPEERGGTGS